jgi:DNA-directed RNA polymerase sigma subunit (sigma70/sigma32)
MLDAFHMVLTERHRFVLTRRYGLEDNEFRTLSEVGKEMSLSRERVRQIEREALNRLRDQTNIRDNVA